MVRYQNGILSAVLLKYDKKLTIGKKMAILASGTRLDFQWRPGYILCEKQIKHEIKQDIFYS